MRTRHLLLLLPLLLAACQRPAPPAPAAPPAPKPVPPPPPARVWDRGTAAVPVIMYHDVVPSPTVWFDLTTAEFERQMAALKAAGAHVVPLADVAAHLRDGAPLPPRAISLTFDDGTLGLLEHAWPVLKRYGYPATFFVHTGYVGKPSPSKEHVTWDQLRELEATGLIDVQPHTVTHPEDLRALSDAQLTQELGESKAAVEREMGHPARWFANPYGYSDERVARAVEAAGFEAQWVEDRDWNASPVDRFHLPRFAPKRLDDILARWQRPEPEPRGSDVLRLATPAPESGELTVGGVRVRWRRDTWPTRNTEPGPLEVADLKVPCVYALLGGGEWRQLPPERQFATLDQPLVIAGPDQIRFTRFRAWMNLESAHQHASDPLDHLLPGARLAVIGSRWLVHEGRPVGEGTLRRPGLVAVDAQGHTLIGVAEGSVEAAALAEALVGLGVVEAVGVSG